MARYVSPLKDKKYDVPPVIPEAALHSIPIKPPPSARLPYGSIEVIFILPAKLVCSRDRPLKVIVGEKLLKGTDSEILPKLLVELNPKIAKVLAVLPAEL